jgi:uncharacterized membrane protein HdeD (DUF308 family)
MPTHAPRDRTTAAALKPLTHLWWVPLVLGVAWMVVALVVLQFDVASVRTISIIFGVILLAAALDEISAIALAPGWRWLHAALAGLFLVGGVAALAWPDVTFQVAAHLLAWFLLAKGVVDVVIALSLKDQLELWGLTLAVGVLEIAVAFWAVGYSGRSAVLLILWVGIGALAKGVTNILVAFQVRSLGRDVVAAAERTEGAVPAQGAPTEQAPGTPTSAT